jgi:GrpB-like predicted nucleotidyltransferase (UPF0157 family)
MPITVCGYDPEWVARYEAERDLLARVLAPHVVTIEHIGSTSVPGLAAKPIVDIAVAVRTMGALADLRIRLRGLDYRYGGEGRVPNRHFLAKPATSKTANGDRRFNLHLTEAWGADYEAHILFRDYLRTHPEIRDAYSALKRQIAAEVVDDITAYIDRKTGFVLSCLAEARAARGASVT